MPPNSLPLGFCPPCPSGRPVLPPAALERSGHAYAAHRRYWGINDPQIHPSTDGVLAIEAQCAYEDAIRRHVLDDVRESTTVSAFLIHSCCWEQGSPAEMMVFTWGVCLR